MIQHNDWEIEEDEEEEEEVESNAILYVYQQ